MMQKALRFIGVVILSCMALTMQAETKWDHINQRNELRIGWGDQLFETLMWNKQTYGAVTYYQHLWIEYQWRFNHWFSLGGMMDGSGVSWDNTNHYFYNIVIMPTVRFTYFHHPNVNLYSGIGLGMDINGGTETNMYGQYVDYGMAVDVTVFGVSANYDRWFWTVDFGGMTALKNANTIFMVCSRMINVSFGARF